MFIPQIYQLVSLVPRHVLGADALGLVSGTTLTKGCFCFRKQAILSTVRWAVEYRKFKDGGKKCNLFGFAGL